MPHLELRLPGRRLDLINFVQQLADPTFQRREWIEHTTNYWWATFDEVVHFLFDDTALSESPEVHIGEFLFDQTEAACMTSVCSAIDSVLNRYGGQLTDGEYMDKPEWESVVSLAQEALKTLETGGHPRET